MAEAISSTLSSVVSACVLNQSRGFWLLSDALASTISMVVRLDTERGELEARVRAASIFDFDTKLLLLSARMREQVVKVLSPFLSFISSYKLATAHNMLALMLDPRFKELALVGSYLGREVATQVAQEYDQKLFLPLLISVYRKQHGPVLADASTVALAEAISISGDANAVFGAGVSEEDTVAEHVSKHFLFHLSTLSLNWCL